MTLHLRHARPSDASWLLEWRNDPATRLASISEAEVDAESHEAWLLKAIAGAGRTLLIAETDRPVGVVRLDFGDSTEMSWTVAPEARGQGIGLQMVRAALPSGRVFACIKSENIPSQRIAAGAGFTLLSDGRLQRWERAG
ncbi:GNAT family N-acetyltransferase [Methylobacterium sp. PvR107]|uniref:GNAT family N-acetyltransferase n=1 Tax=Methylobacterium sp. PvR107 TaxID=2806597 RepID=UPI001AE0EB1F